MRDGGNDHESSWQAAYSYIKKQKGGLFKTSPKQAAGQIIETVVRERDKFSYCIEYLDQLHPDRKLQLENIRKENKRKKEERLQEKKIRITQKIPLIDTATKITSIINYIFSIATILLITYKCIH